MRGGASPRLKLPGPLPPLVAVPGKSGREQQIYRALQVLAHQHYHFIRIAAQGRLQDRVVFREVVAAVLRNYSIGEYRITSVRQSTIGHGMIGE